MRTWVELGYGAVGPETGKKGKTPERGACRTRIVLRFGPLASLSVLHCRVPLPPDLPVAPTQFALAESAATVCFQSCFALFLGLPESTSSLRSGRSPEITSSLKLLPPFGRGAACGLDGLQIAPSLSTGRALKALPRRRSGRSTTGLAQGSTFAPSTPASAIRPGVKTDSQCTYWIVKSHSSGLTRSQNSRACRSERSPETTSSLRSGRSRGASMGSDSLLQGDLLRQSLRSCLDYAGSNAEGRRSCCFQHEHVPGCARNDGP